MISNHFGLTLSKADVSPDHKYRLNEWPIQVSTNDQDFFLISSNSFRNSSLSRRAWSICRDFEVTWRWPRMGVSCKCCAQPRNWREMLSAIDFKSEISDLRS